MVAGRQAASGGVVHHGRLDTAFGDGRGLANRKVKPKLYCSFCGKAFNHIEDHRRHVRVHTGEKPYPCPYCDYKSSRKSNLKGHVARRHHKIINAPASPELSGSSHSPKSWLSSVMLLRLQAFHSYMNVGYRKVLQFLCNFRWLHRFTQEASFSLSQNRWWKCLKWITSFSKKTTSWVGRESRIMYCVRKQQKDFKIINYCSLYLISCGQNCMLQCRSSVKH